MVAVRSRTSGPVPYHQISTNRQMRQADNFFFVLLIADGLRGREIQWSGPGRWLLVLVMYCVRVLSLASDE